jgi:hypothetical protein
MSDTGEAINKYPQIQLQGTSDNLKGYYGRIKILLNSEGTE